MLAEAVDGGCANERTNERTHKHANKHTSKHALRLVYRILLIEDDDELRRGLSKLLRQHGIEVVEAGTLDAALAVPLDDIDLIIADVWLGHRRVHEIVPELRRRAPLVPILGWTGNADVEDGFELCRLGAHELLKKSNSLDGLIERIEPLAREVAGGSDTRFADFKKLRPAAVRRLLRLALDLTDGNLKGAARLLGYTTAAIRYRRAQATRPAPCPCRGR